MRKIKQILFYLDVSLTYIKQAFLTVIEYPASIIGWLISNPIQFIVGFATIRFVVQQFGHINGWDYGQLAVLYGLSVISHGLWMLLVQEIQVRWNTSASISPPVHRYFISVRCMAQTTLESFLLSFMHLPCSTNRATR